MGRSKDLEPVLLEFMSDPNSDNINRMISETLKHKCMNIVNEFHNTEMSESSMVRYLKMLSRKVEDSDAMMRDLIKDLDLDCGVKDFSECAKKLCSMDGKKCDELIHKLEKKAGVHDAIKDFVTAKNKKSDESSDKDNKDDEKSDKKDDKDSEQDKD